MIAFSPVLFTDRGSDWRLAASRGKGLRTTPRFVVGKLLVESLGTPPAREGS